MLEVGKELYKNRLIRNEDLKSDSLPHCLGSFSFLYIFISPFQLLDLVRFYQF
jgi:hypothetical protein